MNYKMIKNIGLGAAFSGLTFAEAFRLCPHCGHDFGTETDNCIYCGYHEGSQDSGNPDQAKRGEVVRAIKAILDRWDQEGFPVTGVNLNDIRIGQQAVDELVFRIYRITEGLSEYLYATARRAREIGFGFRHDPHMESVTVVPYEQSNVNLDTGLSENPDRQREVKPYINSQEDVSAVLNALQDKMDVWGALLICIKD